MPATATARPVPPSVEPHAPTLHRLLPALVLAGIWVWALVAWLALRPPEIAWDTAGWRQSDTQTIALGMMERPSSLLYPRVAWGGDGPGYVETEFQLYTFLVGILMRAFGPGEWAGQLVSLVAVAAAASIAFRHLERRHGSWAGALGVAAFLAARTIPHLATSIQPDGLALLAYVAAWACFCRYVERDRSADLLGFAAWGALAFLVKPTTAHLGISSAVLLALTDRRRLLRWQPWAAWVAMLAVLAVFLAHARQLYLEYGNTFGVLSGGDSKLPALGQLLRPAIHLRAFRHMCAWGLGMTGTVALVVQLARRRFRPEHWSLLLGNVAGLYVAFRYTSSDAGLHYFAPTALLGAVAVASLAHDLAEHEGALRRFQRPLVATMAVLLAAEVAWVVRYRHLDRDGQQGEVATAMHTGRALARLARPGELVVVRSTEMTYDPEWRTANNYEDPRILYVSRTRGWLLSRDEEQPTKLAEYAGRGARFFADPFPRPDSALQRWLSSHAVLAFDGGADGQIWQLPDSGQRRAEQ